MAPTSREPSSRTTKSVYRTIKPITEKKVKVSVPKQNKGTVASPMTIHSVNSKTLNLASALSHLENSRSLNRQLYSGASTKSDSYLARQAKAEKEFLDLLVLHFPNKYEVLLKRDENDIPAVFSILREGAVGEKSMKIRVLNDMLVDFHLTVRNSRDPTKFWEPSTTNSWNRLFFAHLSDKYNICVSVHDFDFIGGLNGVLKRLYNERQQTVEGYGTGKNRKILPTLDEDIFERAVQHLDRNNPTEMIMLILLINGLFFGLRGSTEHCYLTIRNFEKGTFDSTHAFHGYEYIELVQLEDKTHKLTVHNSFKRDTKGSLRLPIIPEDSNSPGQMRLFCQPATIGQKGLFLTKGYPLAMYSPNKELGKNKISEMFKECGEILGLGMSNFSGHALRRECITKMVTNNVPIAEAMATARHSSVSASLAYQKRPMQSEVAKFKAFGIVPTKEI